MSLYDVPDHPVIRNMERTGYPDGKAPEYPHCPVCNTEEVHEVFLDADGDIVGCEACLSRKDPDQIPAFIKRTDGTPVCPVCHQECEDAWTDTDGNVIGCDCCIESKDAWDQPDCFHDREH